MKCTIVSIVGALCFSLAPGLPVLLLRRRRMRRRGSGDHLAWAVQHCPWARPSPMYRNGTSDLLGLSHGVASIVVGWLIWQRSLRASFSGCDFFFWFEDAFIRVPGSSLAAHQRVAMAGG